MSMKLRYFNFIFFVLLLLYSCNSHNSIVIREIEFENSVISYSFNTDKLYPGQILFIEFNSKMQKGYDWNLSTIGTTPLNSLIYDFYKVDKNGLKSVAEIIWLKPGEYNIENLKIIITDINQINHDFILEPFELTVLTNFEGLENEKPEQQLELLFSAFSDFKKFTLNNPFLFYIIPLLFSLLFIVTVIIIFIYMIINKKNREKEKNQLINKFKSCISEYRNEPTNQVAIIELYNILIESRDLLHKKSMRVNEEYYLQLSNYIEASLFSKSPLKSGRITQNKFITLFESWINQIVKYQGENEDV